MNSTRNDRRGVLLGGVAGLATFAAPGWIHGAFARRESGPRPPASESVEGALARARSVGKPLMAIVIPREEDRPERGRLWGDLFGLVPEPVMADFALCEWICASPTDLARAVPEGRCPPEAVAVLIETSDARARTQFVPFETESLDAKPKGGLPLEAMRERAERLGRLLQASILPEPESWKRRSSESMARTGASGDSAFLNEWIRPRLQMVDRHAAMVRADAENWPHLRSRCISTLAQAAALRLWEGEPAGARWTMVAVDRCTTCGMGRMPTDSRAFLEFFVAKDR